MVAIPEKRSRCCGGHTAQSNQTSPRSSGTTIWRMTTVHTTPNPDLPAIWRGGAWFRCISTPTGCTRCRVRFYIQSSLPSHKRTRPGVRETSSWPQTSPVFLHLKSDKFMELPPKYRRQWSICERVQEPFRPPLENTTLPIWLQSSICAWGYAHNRKFSQPRIQRAVNRRGSPEVLKRIGIGRHRYTPILSNNVQL